MAVVHCMIKDYVRVRDSLRSPCGAYTSQVGDEKYP